MATFALAPFVQTPHTVNDLGAYLRPVDAEVDPEHADWPTEWEVVDARGRLLAKRCPVLVRTDVPTDAELEAEAAEEAPLLAPGAEFAVPDGAVPPPEPAQIVEPEPVVFDQDFAVGGLLDTSEPVPEPEES